MENAWKSAYSICFPRGGWKGECFTLLIQNEESIFCRALEPFNSIRCNNLQCGEVSEHAFVTVDSVGKMVLQQWQCDAAGCGSGAVCSRGWCASGHLPLMISVTSSLGRHHKMCGEYWPQPSHPLARGCCLQLWSLPQDCFLRPAAWEMNLNERRIAKRSPSVPPLLPTPE